MKGFKDKSGKFRPTEKRNKSSLKKQDVTFKKPISFGESGYDFQKQKAGLHENFEQQIFEWDELSDIAQMSAVADLKTDIENDHYYYTEDEGLLYDVKGDFAGHDVFKDVIPKGWGDLDEYSNDKIIQFHLELKDNPNQTYSDSDAEDKLFHYLRISSKLQERIFPRFPDPDGISNEIEFKEHETGDEIDIKPYNNYDEYKEDMKSAFVPNLTKREYDQLERAIEKWNELMEMSAQHLKDSYQWYQDSDNLKQMLHDRGEDYDKYGNVKRVADVEGRLVSDED